MVGTFFLKALESRPRFSLNSSNGVLTRFSGHDYLPWEESCVILHVNLSGVAIAVPEPLTPVLGEWILLEVPNELSNEPNCFYGKVVHIQSLSDDFRGVVIQFLSQHLSEKFEMSRAFQDLQLEKKSETRGKFKSLLGVPSTKNKFFLVVLALVWLFTIFLIFSSLLR